jgi:hypothetical protein
VLTGLPPSSTIEVRACRDVWTVFEQPDVQPLFVSREKAIEHARQLLGNREGMIEVRDEDSMLLATFDLREPGSQELACA